MLHIRWFFAAFVALFSLGVLAQAVPATAPVPRVVFPVSTVGSVSTVGAVTADAANAAKFSFGVAANGSIFANSGANLPTAGGASLPLAVTGQVSKANVARAIGRASFRVFAAMSQLGTAYQVGEAMYDLGKELNLDPSASGFVRSLTSPPVNTPSSVVREYMFPDQGYLGAWAISLPLAAQAWANAVNQGGVYSETFSHCVGSICHLSFVEIATGRTGTETISNSAVSDTTIPAVNTPGTTTTTLLTEAELTDAIASRSGWPTSSALARALVKSLDNQESVSVEPQSVTGPSTSPGTSTSTEQTYAPNTSPYPEPVPNASPRPFSNSTPQTYTTTSASTNRYTYNGPAVNTSVTTITSTVNNATGATYNTTPGVAEPVGELVTCGLPSTPPCKIDETGTPEPVEKDVYKPDLDNFKLKQEELAAKAAGSADKTFFSGWSSVFVTPPLAACTGYVLPRDMGTLDPCPVVDGVRTIMAYIWALTALFLAVGMVKKVV